MKLTPLTFPKNFVWGVAAAAPQIEGAYATDGKSLSTWDVYSRIPGKVRNGDTLDVACDHYHLFDKDFAMMAKLGVRHYRLSIAWPRIIPEGRGAVNQKGLDFYHRLFDSMEKHGILPWPTMFHWDLPQALEDAGGWREPGIVEAFSEYADVLVKAYGSRIKRWFTLNELPCFVIDPHIDLNKSPGYPLPPQAINQNIHHALLAHGHGVRAVREYGQRGSLVGMADNTTGVVPVTETPEDIAATQKAYAHLNDRIIGAMLTGGYSTTYLRRLGKDRPKVNRGDFDLISLPADFLGINCYFSNFVRSAKRGGFEILDFPPGYPTTAGWLTTVPQSMYWTTRLAAELYGAKNIYITENGYGTLEEPDGNGEILDLHRREFLRLYLSELRRAIGDGVPIRGYFAWSFMDNFEWNDGYSTRFGLCYTDYKTQKRTPKLSARWYSRVMAENRLV